MNWQFKLPVKKKLNSVQLQKKRLQQTKRSGQTKRNRAKHDSIRALTQACCAQIKAQSDAILERTQPCNECLSSGLFAGSVERSAKVSHAQFALLGVLDAHRPDACAAEVNSSRQPDCPRTNTQTCETEHQSTL